MMLHFIRSCGLMQGKRGNRRENLHGYRSAGPVLRDLSRAPVTVVREHLLPNGSRAGALALQRGGAHAGPMARRGTGPRPTERRNPSGPVARGPVPRDRSTRAKNARRQRPFLVSTDGPARDRPSPYGEENRSWPVARGPVPRDRSRENISSGPLGPACL